MYERFTDRARKVIAFAHQDALRRHAPAVAAEHVLLGILEEGTGVAARVLCGRELDWESVSAAVSLRPKSTPPPPVASAAPAIPGTIWQTVFGRFQQFLAAQRGPRLPLATEGTQLIQHAMEEARSLGHNYIGTEHLLLGILCQPNSAASQLLLERGLTLEALRRSVLEFLGRA